jgi:hypothetical protein
MTDAYTILCGVILGTIFPQAVDNVYLAKADARATLTTAVIPPTVYECGIKVPGFIAVVA